MAYRSLNLELKRFMPQVDLVILFPQLFWFVLIYLCSYFLLLNKYFYIFLIKLKIKLSIFSVKIQFYFKFIHNFLDFFNIFNLLKNFLFYFNICIFIDSLVFLIKYSILKKYKKYLQKILFVYFFYNYKYFSRLY